ncbi:MAG TPA: BON domain-containing protein [Gemmatimonadaceae bacterium]|nr:BON domain-containing protein [Gemmatimonadaceae bacterium]
MPRRFRYRDDEPSSTSTVLGVLAGAIGGFALGMYVSQRVGGIEGLTAKLKRVRTPVGGISTASHDAATDYDDFDDIEEDDFETDEADQGLEERVLEAYRNDPILCERAVDIGSIGDGIIELAGWVDTDDEAEHAVTLARGVPGVETVVNRLAIGTEEEQYADTMRRSAAGDPEFSERHWQGNTIGTGRRRQGTSDEIDRHADPKVELENRWSGTAEALRQSAEDTEAIAAERRRKAAKSMRGDRTGGSPVAPTGVPKSDHVAKPVAEQAD